MNLENTVEQQSNQGLLNKVLDPHGHQIPEHKCEIENGIGCNKRGCCTKSTSITDIVNIFIIQLTIFSCDRLGNTQKFIPNLNIDQEIRRFDLFALQGIIWHEGNSMNSRHYTSTVKVNNTWFIANDTAIREGGRFVCSNNDYITLYVLGYKKVTDFIVPSFSLPVDSSQLFNDIDNAEKLNGESLNKELNFQKNKIQMANKEKKKRDSITSTPKKRRKKHYITERKKREKENKIKQRQRKALDNNAIKFDRDKAQKRMTIHRANRDDNAIKPDRNNAQKRMTTHPTDRDDNTIKADQKSDQKRKKAMRKNRDDNEIKADQKSDPK